jgi:hypothetical protein
MRSGHGQRAARSIGMTHRLVRPSQMSELPMVVTVRLHVTRRCGVTKVCPGTRQAGCHHLVDTRTEARFTVALPDAHQLCVDGKGQTGPAEGAGPDQSSTITGHDPAGVKAKPSGRPTAGLDPGSTQPTTG